jgi:hypothetical protein
MNDEHIIPWDDNLREIIRLLPKLLGTPPIDVDSLDAETSVKRALADLGAAIARDYPDLFVVNAHGFLERDYGNWYGNDPKYDPRTTPQTRELHTLANRLRNYTNAEMKRRAIGDWKPRPPREDDEYHNPHATHEGLRTGTNDIDGCPLPECRREAGDAIWFASENRGCDLDPRRNLLDLLTFILNVKVDIRVEGDEHHEDAEGRAFGFLNDLMPPLEEILAKPSFVVPPLASATHLIYAAQTAGVLYALRERLSQQADNHRREITVVMPKAFGTVENAVFEVTLYDDYDEGVSRRRIASAKKNAVECDIDISWALEGRDLPEPSKVAPPAQPSPSPLPRSAPATAPKPRMRFGPHDLEVSYYHDIPLPIYPGVAHPDFEYSPQEAREVLVPLLLKHSGRISYRLTCPPWEWPNATVFRVRSELIAAGKLNVDGSVR